MNHSSCLPSYTPRFQDLSFVPCSLQLPDSKFVLFCFGWEFHTWIFCVLVNSIPIFFSSILTPPHHLPSQTHVPTNWVHLMFLYVHVHGCRSICWNMGMLLGPNLWKKLTPPAPAPEAVSCQLFVSKSETTWASSLLFPFWNYDK